MWFFEWLNEIFQKNVNAGVVLAAVSGLLVVAAAIGYVCRAKGIYVALCVMIGAGVCVALTAIDMEKEADIVCFAAFFMLGGVLYVSLSAFFALRVYMEKRRKKRAEIARRLLYTLPEKDNTYIRARLNTALGGIAEREETRFLEDEEGQRALVRLEHVRKLLTKIKEAPLTKAERLESEEMTKLFAAYLGKNRWSASDVRAINELFSALLKLSAKYSV